MKAWKGKHVQTHGFIGSVRADASRASFTVTGCSMEDCSTNADADAMIGGPAINALDGPGNRRHTDTVSHRPGQAAGSVRATGCRSSPRRRVKARWIK